MSDGYDQSTKDRIYAQEFNAWANSPEGRAALAGQEITLTRPMVDKKRWGNAAEDGGDPADYSQASYTPDLIAMMDGEQIAREDLPLELLVRGLMLVREDTRPHLVIDCVIKGLNHPFYHSHQVTSIAAWNSVSRDSVFRRMREAMAKLGMSVQALEDIRRGRESLLFPAAEALTQALLYVAEHDEPKSIIDCIFIAVGHQNSDGFSLKTVAREFGITKAGVHKQLTDVKSRLSLPRARYNKSPLASQQYAQFNRNPLRLGDNPVISPLAIQQGVSTLQST